jgi:hypothetical protein
MAIGQSSLDKFIRKTERPAPSTVSQLSASLITDVDSDNVDSDYVMPICSSSSSDCLSIHHRKVTFGKHTRIKVSDFCYHQLGKCIFIVNVYFLWLRWFITAQYTWLCEVYVQYTHTHIVDHILNSDLRKILLAPALQELNYCVSHGVSVPRYLGEWLVRSIKWCSVLAVRERAWITLLVHYHKVALSGEMSWATQYLMVSSRTNHCVAPRSPDFVWLCK